MKTLHCCEDKKSFMKERRSRLGEDSAQAIYYRAEAIYRATRKKVTDPRLTDACHVLGFDLPWEEKLKRRGGSGASLPPVPTKTPEEIKEREKNFIRERYGKFRVASY
jgi:hypothetical protein